MRGYLSKAEKPVGGRTGGCVSKQRTNMVKELKVAAAGLQHVLPASSCRMRSRAGSRPGACAGEAGPPQLSSPDPASSEHTLLVMLWGVLTCLGPAYLAIHFIRGSPPR